MPVFSANKTCLLNECVVLHTARGEEDEVMYVRYVEVAAAAAHVEKKNLLVQSGRLIKLAS